ncbi:MAG: aldo/keto reductase [Sphaerochaetaceae bacterium]
MKYHYLGTSGLAVSEMTLGTMTFGAAGWGCDEKEAHRILSAYIEAGGNMLDCADVYAKGESERIIGTFLPSVKRDQVLIATKCNFPFDSHQLSLGSSRKHIFDSVEASLRRLNTDYIDIYYLHRHDPAAQADEVMESLDLLKQQGKILYSACSNLPAWRVVLNSMSAKHRGNSSFVCGQYMYNLIDRTAEQEIIPALINQGIGLLCWSPLAGGLLTGKYHNRDQVPQDSRFEHRKALDIPRFWTKRGKSIADEVYHLSQQFGIAATDLSLAWLLSKEYVSSVILGARSLQQLKELLGASEVELPAELTKRLDEISSPQKSYHWLFTEETNQQFTQRAALFPGTLIL